MRPVSPPKRGVKFPSNTTGNDSRNVRYKNAPSHYNNAEENESRSTKYKKISRRLATRRVRNKPLKSVLKRGKTAKLRRHSA